MVLERLKGMDLEEIDTLSILVIALLTFTHSLVSVLVFYVFSKKQDLRKNFTSLRKVIKQIKIKKWIKTA